MRSLRVPRLLCVCLLLLVVCALLAACPAAGKPKIQGEYLIPPKVGWLDQLFAAEHGGLGSEIAFQHFRGSYPQAWPPGLSLPQGSYTSSSGEIGLTSADNSSGSYVNTYRVELFCPGGAQSLLDQFTAGLKSAGWHYAVDNPAEAIPDAKLDAVKTPPFHLLTAGPSSGAKYPQLSLRIYGTDFGGYSFIQGAFISN